MEELYQRQSGSLDRQIIRTKQNKKLPCKTRKKQSSSRLKLSEKSMEHVVPETMWKLCGSNNKNIKSTLQDPEETVQFSFEAV